MHVVIGARNKPTIEKIVGESLRIGDEIDIDLISYKKAFPTSITRVERVCKVCGKEKSVAIQQIKEDGTWICTSCATKSRKNEVRETKNSNYIEILKEIATSLGAELVLNFENLQNSRLIKPCENCGRLHSRTYSSWKHLYQNSKWICGACANKEIALKEGHSEKLRAAKLGKPAPLSEDGRRRKSEAAKKMWVNQKEEISQKIRESTARYLQECKPHRIRYNKKSIPYLQQIEKQLGETCHYAEAVGGEFRVKGYFLDFYAPISKLWIEWDEPYHKYYKERDDARTSIILEALPAGTTLIRLNQTEVFLNGLPDVRKGWDH